MRHDLDIIQGWTPHGARVLDLGCGNGELLHALKAHKGVNGYGIERDPQAVVECVERGLNVLQINLNEGLKDFEANSFDVVVLSLTLQAVRRPDLLLREMLRVGKTGIVTFPNFAHWRHRTQLALQGKMPESKELPYKWYETPNIHLCTLKDFRGLCASSGYRVDKVVAVSGNGVSHWLAQSWPNAFGEIILVQFSQANT